MNILATFKSCDPFAELYYPHGATGLCLGVRGYWFAKDREGYYYLLRDVIESMDYTASNGEGMCGVTPTFTDTYWRVSSKAEARFIWMRLVAGKSKRHYENMYTLINK